MIWNWSSRSICTPCRCQSPMIRCEKWRRHIRWGVKHCAILRTFLFTQGWRHSFAQACPFMRTFWGQLYSHLTLYIVNCIVVSLCIWLTDDVLDDVGWRFGWHLRIHHHTLSYTIIHFRINYDTLSYNIVSFLRCLPNYGIKSFVFSIFSCPSSITEIQTNRLLI